MSVIINSVDIGSPAHKAGIKDGYTLISINKNEIMDVLDYRFYITEKKLEIAVQRDGEEKTFVYLRTLVKNKKEY